MAERERRVTPPYGGVFVPRSQVLDADGVGRALVRIAHEVLERNAGVGDLVVVCLQTGGVPLAERLADELQRIEGTEVPVGTLDVAFYRDDIDATIRRFARGWSLERMPVVDRAVLRMAIYELLHRPDVPTGAVISEAVELAKRYSTDDSGRFVNGMLSNIAEEVRPDRAD